MIIAFSGIDGSGKTTYADFVVSHLKNKEIKASYTHITRDSFYHYILHNLIGKLSSSSRQSLEDGLRNKKGKFSFVLTGVFKKTLLLINLIIFNLRYGACKANPSKTIICDRYFYDDIVQLKYLGLSGRLFLSVFERFIIKPDLAYFLKTSAEAAQARKNEYDRDYFIRKDGLYSDTLKSKGYVEVSGSEIKENKFFIVSKLDDTFRL